jgi:hypothetical protein
MNPAWQVAKPEWRPSVKCEGHRQPRAAGLAQPLCFKK